MKKKFEFIADTRFSDHPQRKLNYMTVQLEKNIVDLGILTVFPIRTIDFDDCISYRRTFIIEKRKGFKWDDLFTVINKIQAPNYRNIQYK